MSSGVSPGYSTKAIVRVAWSVMVLSPFLCRVRLAAGHQGDGRGVPGAGGDLVGEVGGVVGDEAEQCRAAGVLPGQAEEVQPGYVGDPAPVHHAAVRCHAGDGDPGLVGPVAGGPDDDRDVEAAAVGESGGVPLGVDQAAPE